MSPLDALLRGYVKAARPGVRWLLRARATRRRLLARRADAVTAGLDPDTAALLALAGLIGQAVSKRPDDERRMMRANILIVEDVPTGGIAVSDERIDAVPARLYVPAGIPRPSPALVFVHGGGWVTGDLETHDTLCRRIALIAGVRVIAIAPRLAPEHPFPATLDDTLAAFRGVARRSAELGIDPDRLGIGGDSAGGNLSAIVGLETRSDAIRPKVTALLYPATDATWQQPSIERNGEGYLLTQASLRWYLAHYIGREVGINNAIRRDPRLSPFHAPDLTGAPRAIVAVAGFDPLLDEGVAYAKRLEEAGVAVELLRYDSLIHGFLLMTGISRAAMSATEEIARRIGAALTS